MKKQLGREGRYNIPEELLEMVHWRKDIHGCPYLKYKKADPLFLPVEDYIRSLRVDRGFREICPLIYALGKYLKGTPRLAEKYGLSLSYTP